MTQTRLDTHWHLDLSWYEENDCSLFALAQVYFCPKCSKNMKKGIDTAEVIETISGCCGKGSGYFKINTPVLAMVFQIFLKNENSPLSLEELAKELSLRHSQASSLTPERLERILKTDKYYGLKPAH